MIDPEHCRHHRVHRKTSREPAKFYFCTRFQSATNTINKTLNFPVDDRKIAFHRRLTEQRIDELAMELVLVAFEHEQTMLEIQSVEEADFVEAFLRVQYDLEIISVAYN